MVREIEERERCKVEGCERPREAGRTECASCRKRRLSGRPLDALKQVDRDWRRQVTETALTYAQGLADLKAFKEAAVEYACADDGTEADGACGVTQADAAFAAVEDRLVRSVLRLCAIYNAMQAPSASPCGRSAGQPGDGAAARPAGAREAAGAPGAGAC